MLDAGGLPLPVTQQVVRRNGRFAARVDFLYEPERIVLEALGYGYHRTPPRWRPTPAGPTTSNCSASRCTSSPPVR
ncbi:MAG: hypothetical protein R2746_08630 [Acidimicrobiales bacterium]